MLVDRVVHLRYITGKKTALSPRRYNVQSKGGWTVVKITNGDSVGIGVARCRLSDTYCKKTGFHYARDRALLALVDLPKEAGTLEKHMNILAPVPVDKLPVSVYNTVYEMMKQ